MSSTWHSKRNIASTIGLSKFCSLRPKWCVTISSSGTHSVCVCTVHQNTKLIVVAFCSTINRVREENRKKKLERQEEGTGATVVQSNVEKFVTDYKILMKMVVGNVKNMECMLHRCENCPGFQKLQSYVEQELERYDIDDVTYSQWDRPDRTSLCSISAPVDEFIELLMYQVDNLTAHSFTAKSQTQ